MMMVQIVAPLRIFHDEDARKNVHVLVGTSRLVNF
jgi:hypothetical protein